MHGVPAIVFLSQALSVLALRLNVNLPTADNPELSKSIGNLTDSNSETSDAGVWEEFVKSVTDQLEPGEWVVRIGSEEFGTFEAGNVAALKKELLETKIERYMDAPVFVRSKGSVRVPGWYGRFGNNLHQVVHAILYAESKGISDVRIPKGGNPSKLFNLPTRFNVQSKLSQHADCGFKKNMFHEQCKFQFSKSDYRQALLTYVKPHMKEDVKGVCRSKEEADQGLVIHLRGGDLASSKHPLSGKPPCSFYTQLIKTHQVSTVTLVMENGKNEICGKLIKAKMKGSTVQVKETDRSFIGDACTLMGSQYVTFGLSTFPEVLSMMSERLEKAYLPAKKYIGFQHFTEYGASNDISGRLDCDGSASSCESAQKRIEYELYDVPLHPAVKFRVDEGKTYSITKTCGHC